MRPPPKTVTMYRIISQDTFIATHRALKQLQTLAPVEQAEATKNLTEETQNKLSQYLELVQENYTFVTLLGPDMLFVRITSIAGDSSTPI